MKKNILKAFKSLHRVAQETFIGDASALSQARQRINLEFRKEVKTEEIPEKLKVAEDVGKILKHQVVQASKNPETDNYGKPNIFFNNFVNQYFHSFRIEAET